MKSESQRTEYKRSWHDEYLGWICGFANAKGGTMFIGIYTFKRLKIRYGERTNKPFGPRLPASLGLVSSIGTT